MRKFSYIILCTLVCVTIFCSGCAFIMGLILPDELHNGDWSYILPNGYELWHLSADKVVLVKNDGDSIGDTIIPAHIKEFCYNEQFIGIQQIEQGSSKQDADLCYYLVDTEQEQVWGPFDQEEYLNQCEQLDIEAMCDWVATKPTPNGVTYYK